MTKGIDITRTFEDLQRCELNSMLSRAVDVLFIEPDRAVLVVTPVDEPLLAAHRAYNLIFNGVSHPGTVLIGGCMASPESYQDGLAGSLFGGIWLSGSSDDLDGGALFAFIAPHYKNYMDSMT
ncbi:hypothetical protein BBC27_09625 [Acidithiobacillus ferrivorans]|uniref:Uncharacterized protein n=1 Tax=Acidithiobacillus ferrivorans TaxID=160808 RepID=A0A1B9BZG7_9PROT|nr:hypothetical protein [Acidithiobacillus ferrivorans]OCB03098.1 hypothetical protein BBC27_09625 [Acidithiobacillus ferrivorans]